ncbi:MAG TPA: FAD-dependent oxidoreductase [Puia sp.]|nr:FAD-dependent oxidoreductase [Puia sp.]
MDREIIVIGGGVIGLSCAYYLNKVGLPVTVIERGDITSGTSFGNAGYISPSHFVPLASPGIIAKGLRWMLSSSSPFYIKPRIDPALVRWGIAFWRSANEKKMQRNIPHLNNILHLSRELMTDIKNDLGNQFRMAEKGCFMLYKSAGTQSHELDLAREAEKLGIKTRILSRNEIQQMEPEVEVDVLGGVLYSDDCHLHPGDFMATLKDHLRINGVRFLLNTEVKGFECAASSIRAILTDGGRLKCSDVVAAAGSWLPNVLRLLGISILMQPGKGYSITYENVDRNLQYPAILVDDRVAMTPMLNDLRMGGTMEISGINDKVLIKRVQAIFNAAKRYYPNLNLQFPETRRIWSGLRPLSPDGLPYIGKHRKFTNLAIAGGHAMLGLSLAAATGKLIAETLSNQITSIDCSAFAVERY